MNETQILCSDRYQQFHDEILERRARWRTEVKHWWSNGDAEVSNQTCQQLVAEGSLLIETHAKSRRTSPEGGRMTATRTGATDTPAGSLKSFELGGHSPRLRNDYEEAPCDYHKDN